MIFLIYGRFFLSLQNIKDYNVIKVQVLWKEMIFFLAFKKYSGTN